MPTPFLGKPRRFSSPSWGHGPGYPTSTWPGTVLETVNCSIPGNSGNRNRRLPPAPTPISDLEGTLREKMTVARRQWMNSQDEYLIFITLPVCQLYASHFTSINPLILTQDCACFVVKKRHLGHSRAQIWYKGWSWDLNPDSLATERVSLTMLPHTCIIWSAASFPLLCHEGGSASYTRCSWFSSAFFDRSQVPGPVL